MALLAFARAVPCLFTRHMMTKACLVVAVISAKKPSQSHLLLGVQ